MNRSVVAHAVLLLVGMTSAFLVWTRDKSSSEKEVVLIDGEEADLERVVFVEGESRVEVVGSGAGENRKYRVQLTRMVIPGKAPNANATASGDAGVADAGAAAAPEPEKVQKTFNFPGGMSVRRSTAKVLPMKSRRQLDEVPEDRLKKMGMDPPEATFEVTAKGQTHVFEVGAKTYGSQSRYLRLKGEKTIHLVDSDAMGGLEGTETRLAERRLVRIRQDKVLGFTVERGEKKASFEHQERDQPKKRHFTLPGEPTKRVDEAEGSLSSLRALRANKYLSKDEAGPLSPAGRFRLDMEDQDPIEGIIYEPSGEKAYVQVGEWLAEIRPSQAKAVLDDMQSALP